MLVIINIIRCLYKAMDDINQINNLYNTNTFGKRYGVQIWISIIIIIVFIAGVSYFRMTANIKQIKKNWVTEKCKPHILPIAGHINAPKGVSTEEYTLNNFSMCIQNILDEAIEVLLAPLYFSTFMISLLMEAGIEGIQAFRNIMSYMRDCFLALFGKVFEIIEKVLVAFQGVVAVGNAIFAKIHGSFISAQNLIAALYGIMTALIKHAYIPGIILYIGFLVGVLILIGLWMSGIFIVSNVAGGAAYLLMPVVLLLFVLLVYTMLIITKAQSASGRRIGPKVSHPKAPPVM